MIWKASKLRFLKAESHYLFQQHLFCSPPLVFFIPLFFPPPPPATGPCKQSAEISQGVEYFYKPAHCDEYIKALLEAAQAFMG